MTLSKLPKGARVIGHRVICGIAITIIRGNVTHRDGLSDSFGYFDEAAAQIWIRDGQTKNGERDTINHELTHAWLRFSGAQSFLAGELAKPDRVDAVEETLIRILTPHAASLEFIK